MDNEYAFKCVGFNAICTYILYIFHISVVQSFLTCHYFLIIVFLLNCCVCQITFYLLYLGSFVLIFSTFNSVGDNDIASTVINESVVEGEEAQKFLEDVNVTYR